jgi:hypothetical protein
MNRTSMRIASRSRAALVVVEGGRAEGAEVRPAPAPVAAKGSARADRLVPPETAEDYVRSGEELGSALIAFQAAVWRMLDRLWRRRPAHGRRSA